MLKICPQPENLQTLRFLFVFILPLYTIFYPLGPIVLLSRPFVHRYLFSLRFGAFKGIMAGHGISADQKENTLARDNYSYKKYQRELMKKNKKEEKLQRKLDKKNQVNGSPDQVSGDGVSPNPSEALNVQDNKVE